MKILYGVVGEGMGHATRSRVVIEHLLKQGHEICIVVSGRAYAFLKECYAENPQVRVKLIHGLSLSYADNKVKKRLTLISNLRGAPKGLITNVGAYRKILEIDFSPELVVSDFDSWAYLYALNNRIPVISIDNMQVLNRCEHSSFVTDNQCKSFRLAKNSVKAKMPGAYHYLASSFFFPKVRKARTTLVPPILRPEILAAKREAGKHIVVYQSGPDNEGLLELLKGMPYEFRVYGMKEAQDTANIRFRPFSQDGFIEDLRTARAVIAGGGYSLMGEAVHLGVPMLSVPIEGQYEQELNARYLSELGYGAWAPKLCESILNRFLNNLETYSHELKRYPRQGNEMLFKCLDELIDDIRGGRVAPDFLAAESMGSFEILRRCA